MLYEWPPATAFNRVISKDAIIKNASANTATRSRFTHEVAQIRWAHKISPDTYNLSGNQDFSEFQIIHVWQKTEELHYSILETIDRAILTPLIFELYYDNKIRTVAAYKRPSLRDESKSVTGDYFSSAWIPTDTPRVKPPAAIHLEALYEALIRRQAALYLTRIVGNMNYDGYRNLEGRIEVRLSKELGTCLEQVEHIVSTLRTVDRLESKKRREKQFNRQVQYHQQARNLKASLKPFFIEA